MRAAFIVSGLVHLVLLAFAVVSLPSSEGYATPPVAALPIEILTIEEATEITEGRPEETEVALAPAPETVEVPEPPPVAEAQPGASDAPAETIATEEEAIDSPDQSTAPEPSGEPEVAEPEPEPEEAAEAEAAPVEPEPTPQPIEAPQDLAEEAAPVPETVVPRARPTPPRRTRTARIEEPREEEFDADTISALLNRTAPTGGGTGAAQASAGAEGGRLDAPQTAAWKDAVMDALRRCWIRPAAIDQREELAIVVEMTLAQDGSLARINDVRARGIGPIFDIAADAARRAVLKCTPFEFLPPSAYEDWKELQVTFDPRELMP
ncbi:hypothetical protein [Acuticoccus sp.]|uniref:hypothetical protein n=1 Tax=Acuticoccus sp. TaxID=1904378 RepID=UPI003B52E432